MEKAEKMRVYARCKWRGQHMLGLKGEDLRKFVSECMSEEIKANRERPLKKGERLRRPLQLVTKQKRRPQKPTREHKFLYVNVTPSTETNPLQDFFVDPIPESKKEELNQFMRKHGKVPIETLLKKIEELEEE